MDEIRNANILNSKDNSLDMVDKSSHGLFDPRLSLFGYTNETVNMLLVPMFRNKYVVIFKLLTKFYIVCL